jgi:hypothetical protein
MTPQQRLPSGFGAHHTTAREALGEGHLAGTAAIVTGGYAGVGPDCRASPPPPPRCRWTLGPRTSFHRGLPGRTGLPRAADNSRVAAGVDIVWRAGSQDMRRQEVERGRRSSWRLGPRCSCTSWEPPGCGGCWVEQFILLPRFRMSTSRSPWSSRRWVTSRWRRRSRTDRQRPCPNAALARNQPAPHEVTLSHSSTQRAIPMHCAALVSRALLLPTTSQLAMHGRPKLRACKPPQRSPTIHPIPRVSTCPSRV